MYKAVDFDRMWISDEICQENGAIWHIRQARDILLNISCKAEMSPMEETELESISTMLSHMHSLLYCFASRVWISKKNVGTVED